jgi:hypothetical protein
MKTPREILLEKHAAAQDKLSALRRNTIEELARVAAECSSEKKAHPIRVPAWMLWREWLWSLRRQLAPLGAAWLLIALLGVDVTSAPRAAIMAVNPRQAMLVAREHQRQLAELLAPTEERLQSRRDNPPPSPRSQCQPSTLILI